MKNIFNIMIVGAMALTPALLAEGETTTSDAPSSIVSDYNEPNPSETSPAPSTTSRCGYSIQGREAEFALYDKIEKVALKQNKNAALVPYIKTSKEKSRRLQRNKGITP